VIDFGGATYDNDSEKSTIVNTRQYRGPEVTLEVGWSLPSDIWCCGCIIAELISGELLYVCYKQSSYLKL
jgi:dual-specificity kinase